MGVQYRNGKYFGGGSGGDGLIPISQEEFNKLTPEERDNHKSYFIYDAIAQTPSGTHVGIRYYPHQEDYDALSEAEKAAIPDLVITGGKRDSLSARDVQYKQGTVEAALDDIEELKNTIIAPDYANASNIINLSHGQSTEYVVQSDGFIICGLIGAWSASGIDINGTPVAKAQTIGSDSVPVAVYTVLPVKIGDAIHASASGSNSICSVTIDFCGMRV